VQLGIQTLPPLYCLRHAQPLKGPLLSSNRATASHSGGEEQGGRLQTAKTGLMMRHSSHRRNKRQTSRLGVKLPSRP
jgi:hypothetical protein